MYQKTLFRILQKHRLFIMITLVMVSFPGISNAQFYLDTTATIEARVDSLLSQMTLDEKISQMVQHEIINLAKPSDVQTYCLGSVLISGSDTLHDPETMANICDTLQTYALKTRLGIPLLIGMDAIHGAGPINDATIFPHNIGLGCTRNPRLLIQATQITAQEVMATGFNWTFSPIVAVSRNNNWNRTYESYSEDPNLVKEMSGAAVLGYQGDTSAKNITVLACAKHFIGDGGTTGGLDGLNTQVDEATLRAIHLPGYLTAIQQKVGSIIVCSGSWNTVPCIANKYLLTTLLKEELQFKGLLLTDMNGLDQVPGKTRSDQYSNAINAGIDMAMFGGPVILPSRPMFIDTVLTSVEQGKISLDRIDDAVRRILTQKFRLGLFEHPFANRSLLSQIGSLEHRLVARECVRQSLVLLKKKDGVLPIPKNIKHIHMIGRHANNIGYQCGGWTSIWQGGTTIGTTIMQAVQQAAPSASVTYSADGYGADSADIGIAVIGETPYQEGSGIQLLSPQDIQAVRNLKSYNIPVILILISGRPIYVDPILPHCDALIAAWLPGTEGEGITDVLFGDYQPTGILSRTWPKDASQFWMDVDSAIHNPLFPFGYGITSLSNSPAGSPPEVYSAGTTMRGQTMEISFNKKMIPPPVSSSGFSVLVDGITPMTVTGISLKPNDSTTLVLTFADSLRKGKTYTISYVAGAAQSHDHGQLTAFNNLPVYNLLNDYNMFNAPGKIEAETYYIQQGLTVLSCSDVGGGYALGVIDDGDWVEYSVNVAQSGDYSLDYRISSAKLFGKIDFTVNGSSLDTADIPITGSFTTWQTITTKVHLSAGPQIIKLIFMKGGLRLHWMQFSLSSTEVQQQAAMPQNFQLFQNYPNPFNPSTTIQYALPARSKVKLRIYNVLGQVVANLLNFEQSAGWKQAVWKANVASGIYFYRIEATSLESQNKHFVETRKMLLLR